MKFVKTLLGKSTDENKLKMKKESAGEWVVRKGSTVLYIGSKDKCETYMSHAM
ncbi:hypothetical protein SAMN05421640_2352 [Ekhidna lutea]|uniref:Uncharacterized protein n=1 Tax=Ekhidna lutea TaxID=447679 RepID=A0A239K204_EKHLU|nr:hypothetical protein [Ekhidna lutea]SNT11703.1 hypothetical protein SAMN05421640_2352 [Ekhidna lutea]